VFTFLEKNVLTAPLDSNIDVKGSRPMFTKNFAFLPDMFKIECIGGKPVISNC
jgi:hypothetical protein